jgi:hypothetical protein
MHFLPLKSLTLPGEVDIISLPYHSQEMPDEFFI